MSPAFGVGHAPAVPASTVFDGVSLGVINGPYGKHQWDVKVIDIMSKNFIIVSTGYRSQ